tara:strand:- start:239 stop:1051 length:813 start_codon:yes stop_codon:yes gene_type:complete
VSVTRGIPGGDLVSRSFPSEPGDDGGGGSNVTSINAALTPTAATVTLPSTGDLISGGMLDGWRMFDPSGGVTALADDGNYFDITYNKGSAQTQWIDDKLAPTKQPFFCWPNKIMGNFVLTLQYTGNRGAGVSHQNTNCGVFCVAAYPTDTNLGRYYGIEAYTWWASHAAAKWGAQAMGTQKSGYTGAVLTWTTTNTLKLTQAEGIITAQYRQGTSGALTTSTTPGVDNWGVAGDASYIGIGLYTNRAAGSEEVMSLVSVDLTGSEWTATP